MRCSLFVMSVVVSVASALISALEASAGQARASSLSVPPVLEGVARAIDGDTLDVASPTGTVRVRLQAIDAAEGGQRCKLRWIGTWDCGRAATIALEQLTAGRTVTCKAEGTDRHGRVLGVCFTGGQDINAALVRAGLAWAYVHYSDRYVAEEQTARLEQLGIWQAATMPPWEWRASQRARTTSAEIRALRSRPDPGVGWRRPADVAPASPPARCDIKGNVTANGRIYHTRESPWYARIDMTLAGGRRWFCTEQEAREAGWRAAGEARRADVQ